MDPTLAALKTEARDEPIRWTASPDRSRWSGIRIGAVAFAVALLAGASYLAYDVRTRYGATNPATRDPASTALLFLVAELIIAAMLIYQAIMLVRSPFARRPVASRVAFALTDRRLFSVEPRGAEVKVASAPVARVKELVARWDRPGDKDADSPDMRLLQELRFYCATEKVNDFKRALDRLR